ncbi:hypothetical protein KJ671_00100 [Patescibacteria group bacterium]|nr:hypothetical protein [Patescibacteria group bacterium]
MIGSMLTIHTGIIFCEFKYVKIVAKLTKYRNDPMITIIETATMEKLVVFSKSTNAHGDTVIIHNGAINL